MKRLVGAMIESGVIFRDESKSSLALAAVQRRSVDCKLQNRTKQLQYRAKHISTPCQR